MSRKERIERERARLFTFYHFAKYYSYGMLFGIFVLLFTEASMEADVSWSWQTGVGILLLLPSFYFYMRETEEFNQSGGYFKLAVFLTVLIGVLMSIFVCAFLFGMTEQLLN